MQQREGCVPQGTNKASWSLFARRFAPLFSCSFLGLATIRVWLQCCVYDLYAATDSGMATVVVNLTRGIVTLVLMAIFARRAFSTQTQNRLGVASCILMTCGCVLLLAASETQTPLLGWIACVLSALGVVWGGGMWITFYERLDPEESLLYAFSALPLSCLAGLALGLLPKSLTMLVGAFMPALSLVTFRDAMQSLNGRDGARCTPGATPRKVASLPYTREFHATFLRFLAGVALFSLALGFARGFPYGQAIELSGAMRVLHQLLTCLLCAGVLWLVLVEGRCLRLSALWNMPLMLLVIGVLLLACLTPQLMQVGSALVTVANTFTLAVLWYVSYDVARNMHVSSYLVLGAVWVTHQVPREAGRLIAMGVGPYDSSPMLVAMCMIVLLAGSMFLLVSNSTSLTRPLFADLNSTDPAINSSQNQGASQGDAYAPAFFNTGTIATPGTTSGAPRTTVNSEIPAIAGTSPAGPAATPTTNDIETRLLLMGKHYDLTRREVDIARLLIRDLSKVQIGEALCLSESTIRTHARNLYAKLDVHSREQLKELVEEFRL